MIGVISSMPILQVCVDGLAEKYGKVRSQKVIEFGAVIVPVGSIVLNPLKNPIEKFAKKCVESVTSSPDRKEMPCTQKRWNLFKSSRLLNLLEKLSKFYTI